MATQSLSTQLAGMRMLLPVNRKSDELANALERHGAEVSIAPPLRIIPTLEDPVLLEQCEHLATQRPDYVVVTTSAGFRGLMSLLDKHPQLGNRVRESLGEATFIARGPKSKGAIIQAGFTPAWTAESETAAEVQERLLLEDLQGKHLVVQHHGAGDDGLNGAFTGAGAEVTGLTTYKWTEPHAPELVDESVRDAAVGAYQAVMFTSAPAADRWLRTAEKLGFLPEIVRATHGTGETPRLIVVAVGPVTAQPLLERGITPIAPERYRLGAMVKTLLQYVATSGNPGTYRPE